MSLLTLSDRAAQRLKELAATRENQNVFLRLAVMGGGCAGFQYSFSLDDQVTPDDVVIHQGDARVVVDQTSLTFLKGATVDYKTELMGAHFIIQNPNAVSGCGCGNSFSPV